MGRLWEHPSVILETLTAKIFSAKFESVTALGAVACELYNHTLPAMLAAVLISLLLIYLLVGVALCVKGRLATDIAYETAILATYSGAPAWKVSAYRWALRAGVVVAWPVFWFSS